MRALLFAVIACCWAISASCTDNKQPPVTGRSIADSADQVLFGANFILTTNGVQRGDLTADTAFVLDETTRFDLRKTHVNFTSETGAPEGTMDAHRGVYRTQNQILEGWGDVVVKFVDGRMLRSPHVIYNSVTHQISSDTSFTLARGEDMQSGIGFTLSQPPGAKASASGGFTSFRCMRACTGRTSVRLPER